MDIAKGNVHSNPRKKTLQRLFSFHIMVLASYESINSPFYNESHLEQTGLPNLSMVSGL